MEKFYSNSISLRIKQGSWRDAFPPFGPKIGFGKKLEKSEDSWGDKWLEVESLNNIAKTLGQSIGKPNENEKIKPVPLEDMHSFIDKIEEWVAVYGNILTYPSSSTAWKKAVEKTIADGDMDSVLVIAASFPEQFKETIKNISIPDNRLGKWLRTVSIAESVEPKPEDQKSALEAMSINIPKQSEINGKITEKSEAESTPVVQSNNKTSEESPKKFYFNKAEQETKVWLKELLLELNVNGKDRSVNKEILDSRVKEWINRQGSKSSMESFFEDEFYGALVNLDINELKSLERFWPNNKKLPIADSLALLSSTKFWGLIKYPEEQERAFLFSNVLPAIISIQKLKFSEKYQIGKEMLKPAVKNAELFRQRLNLWTGIGGVPFEKKPKSANYSEDIFNSNEEEEEVSILSWIIKKDNPMWIKELKNFADERNLVLDSLNEAYEKINKNEQYKPKGLS